MNNIKGTKLNQSLCSLSAELRYHKVLAGMHISVLHQWKWKFLHWVFHAIFAIISDLVFKVKDGVGDTTEFVKNDVSV